MHETDAQPVRHQHRRTAGDLGEPLRMALRVIWVDFREEMADDVVGELPQALVVTARCEDLEVAEANERRRHARDDRAGLHFGTAVVEHVA